MRNKPCLTSTDAHKMMAACKAEAQKNKWNVAIAIVDDSGAVILLERLDGAGAIASEVAMGKARTSAVTKRPTKFFEDRVKERPAFVDLPDPGRHVPGRPAADAPGRVRRRDRRLRRAVARGRAGRQGRRRRAGLIGSCTDLSTSWPGRAPRRQSLAGTPLSRPSTSCLLNARKTWMPGTRPGMTADRLSQETARPESSSAPAAGTAPPAQPAVEHALLEAVLQERLERRAVCSTPYGIRSWPTISCMRRAYS